MRVREKREKTEGERVEGGVRESNYFFLKKPIEVLRFLKSAALL